MLPAPTLKVTPRKMWFAFVVSVDGSVVGLKPLLNPCNDIEKLIAIAAVQAIKQWRFAAATINGAPSPYMLCVPVVINF